MAATNAVGRKLAIGIGEESAYNTAVSPSIWLPVEPDSDIKRSVNVLEASVLQQARMNRKENIAIGTKGASVNLSMPWAVTSGAGVTTLFKHLFGKVTTSGVSDSAYTHTFEVNSSGLFIGLTVVRHKDNHQLTASGVKLKSCGISAKVNEICKLKWEGVGGTIAAAAVTGTPAVSLLAGYPYWTFDKITATWGGNSLALTGAEITLANELFDGEEQSYSLGSAERAMLRAGMFSCEGTITRRFLNDGTSEYSSKFFNVATATTHYPLVLTFASGVLIGASSTYQMTLTIDEAHCEEPELSTDAGLVMETIKFKGRFDGTTSGVTLVVIDNSATPVTATGAD